MTQLENVQVLVTGGGGFVGSWLVRQLLEKKCQVRVLGRNRYPEIELLGAECIQGDLNNPEIVDKALTGCQLVFHVASLAGIWGKWKDYYETNVCGTENLIVSCQKCGVSALVYTSTPSVVFNGVDISGADEQLAYADTFLCHYARSKVTAEKMVLGANSAELSTCALRPHLIWGPGDPHLLPRIIEAGRRGKLKIVGDGENLVDISYVENVAQAHVLAGLDLLSLQKSAGKPYFISQGEPVKLWDWINELFQRLGVPQITGRVPFKLARTVGCLQEMIFKTLFPAEKEPGMTRFLAEQLAKDHYFSMESARSDLGYIPAVSMNVGLERTVTWLQQR